jgi:hypothetical protein
MTLWVMMDGGKGGVIFGDGRRSLGGGEKLPVYLLFQF